jgi:D-3-phosphoglycerate dehydrogenase / 2-oxoglutarate reductase
MKSPTQPTVVIADYDFDDVSIERDIIEPAGFTLVATHAKNEDEVIEVARDASAVIVQYAPVGERAMTAFTHCRVIARYGTGYDIVDVAAATRHQIQVTNVPNDWCVDEVADHAVALLLAIARKISVYDRATHAGVWRWQTGQPIHRLRGRTLGLFSFGNIARQIATRMASFGMRIIAADPFVPAAEMAAQQVAAVSFDDLLAQSDYLVIQAPLTSDTQGLFGESTLRRMKPSAVLVNTARGPIVDDAALARALQEGWIAGAGLDDIAEEPAKQRDWKPRNPLFGLPNVLITPHAAYYSEESMRTVRAFAAHEVVRVLNGLPPLSPVNQIIPPPPDEAAPVSSPEP